MAYWNRKPERLAKRKRQDWLQLVWKRTHFGKSDSDLPAMPEDFEKELAEVFTQDMVNSLEEVRDNLNEGIGNLKHATKDVEDKIKDKPKKSVTLKPSKK